MTKNAICIECPKGCTLAIDIENCKVTSVRGAKCPKGVAYGLAEAENPVRLFTATVAAEGLNLKRIPVRTNKPIPKKDMLRAAEETGRIRIKEPLKAGDVIVENFLSLGIKLLATREAILQS